MTDRRFHPTHALLQPTSHAARAGGCRDHAPPVTGDGPVDGDHSPVELTTRLDRRRPQVLGQRFALPSPAHRPGSTGPRDYCFFGRGSLARRRAALPGARGPIGSGPGPGTGARHSPSEVESFRRTTRRTRTVKRRRWPRGHQRATRLSSSLGRGSRGRPPRHTRPRGPGASGPRTFPRKRDERPFAIDVRGAPRAARARTNRSSPPREGRRCTGPSHTHGSCDADPGGVHRFTVASRGAARAAHARDDAISRATLRGWLHERSYR